MRLHDSQVFSITYAETVRFVSHTLCAWQLNTKCNKSECCILRPVWHLSGDFGGGSGALLLASDEARALKKFVECDNVDVSRLSPEQFEGVTHDLPCPKVASGFEFGA